MRSNRRLVWVWCCLGVLVASCSQSGTAGSPTAQVATRALLKWATTPSPAASPTPAPRLRRTPTLNPATLIALTLAPTPLPLPLGLPNCYETPVGSLLCLGSLHNPLSVPVSQVVVRVYLIDEEGNALDVREVATARSYLLPNESTPYGAQFERLPSEYSSAVAEVARALRNTQALPYLHVENVQNTFAEGIYTLSGTLRNRGEQAVHHISLVATLYDESGQVSGFRQVRLPPDQQLLPNEQLPFSLAIIPQTDAILNFVTSAEGELP